MAANFGREPLDYDLPGTVMPVALALSSEEGLVPPTASLRLRGWQSVIFEIEA
jgi:hypothetical protein